MYNIIIDLSWVANVYGHILDNLSFNGIPTGMYYGTYKLLSSMKKDHPDFVFHICLDSPCIWRKEIYEGYKANRDEKPKLDFQTYVNLCRMLKCIPDTHFYKIPEFEADDLIANLSSKLDNVIIYSGDNDMLQLMKPNVRIAYKYQNKDFVYKDEEYCFEKYGVKPEELKYYRFIEGDKSDNISKVTSRIKTKELQDFAVVWHAEGLSKALEVASDKLRNQLSINSELLGRNRRLMDLSFNFSLPLPTELKVVEDKTLFSTYGMTEVFYG